MRKVIASTYSTLNGVISPVEWSYSIRSRDHSKYARDLLFESDALLMGRETYEVFAEVWPSRTSADDGPGEEGFIDRINGMQKYVASTTLKEPLTWNSTLIKGDLAEEVAKLKQQPGQNILMYGAGAVAKTLIQHGLLDELQILFYPVVAAGDVRLLNDSKEIPALKLKRSQVLDTGVVILTYEPTNRN